MSKLTTHVLDTANGCPGKEITVKLFDSNNVLLLTTTTNGDGRCDEPLLAGDSMKSGSYRLEFAVAEYYKNCGTTLPDTPFLDIVTIAFGIDDPSQHYHVPLLVSPYSYSTYRGS